MSISEATNLLKDLSERYEDCFVSDPWTEGIEDGFNTVNWAVEASGKSDVMTIMKEGLNSATPEILEQMLDCTVNNLLELEVAK